MTVGSNGLFKRRERSAKLGITHEAHISPQILTYYLPDISVDAFVSLYKRFISSLYIKFLQISNFSSNLSQLYLQEFVSLVEEQDCQLFAKIQSCSMFRF